MPNNKKASDIFREFLKQGKNRITPERFEILDAALEFDGHFSADELYISMKNHKSRVSRATVYNTLELLTQCELLSLRNFGDNMKRYESNYKRRFHDHLICLDCGRIVEFTNNKVKNIQQEICDALGFESASYSFNIFVKCKNKKECPYYNGK
ncbi:MAG: transcriptional repressor [Ignavibacteriaceae bacterium]|nr:transcriptional repressor [Ignavibacteriaceae bacterium]